MSSRSTQIRSLAAAIACGLLYCTAATAGGPGHAAFKTIDSNGDGRISAAEHDTHARMMFTAADANKDGSVSETEMHARMKLRHGDGDGHMARADTDRDGRISRTEFVAAHDGDGSRFAAHDANNDGFIAADEMKHHKMGMGKGKKGCCEGGCACCDKMKKAT